MKRTSSVVLLAGLAACLSGGTWAIPSGDARADVIELKDGTKLDGRVIKEEGGFVWLKMLAETKRIGIADIATRTPGKSATETYAELLSSVEKDPKNAVLLFDLYEFQKAHESELPKGEAGRTLQRVLKAAPNHPQARDENGDVEFQGKWVKREDLPRLEAEAARENRRKLWEVKLGVPVTLDEGEHWMLLDNTGEKDGSKRLQELDDAYRKVSEITGIERFWDGRAEAIAFKRYDDYKTYLAEHHKANPMADWKYQAAQRKDLGGFYRNRPTCFIVRFPTEKGAESLWNHFVHNAAHVCMWSYFSQGEGPPTWLEEGIASHVETEIMGVQKSYCVGDTGKDKQGGTTDKRPPKKAGKGGGAMADNVSMYKEKCIEAVQNDEFPSMRKFLRMKLGDYGPAEAGGSLGLVVFLMQKDAEKFKKLVKTLRAAPPKDDQPWNDIYGWKLIEDMETEWKSWVKSQW